MSNLQAFMAQNAGQVAALKRVISERFVNDGKPIEFEFKPIDPEEDKELRKLCTNRKKVKGRLITDFDEEGYKEKLVATCISYPNLKDAELQKSYGVMGEVPLLRKLLVLPGEYAEALLAVQEVNGYDKDMGELVEEAKN